MNSFLPIFRQQIASASSGESVDVDAQTFFDAAGITDDIQKDAINTLVVSMKSEGLWSKSKAIYPFIGGSADTHKFNLKDPRDLDAAFRIVWGGGVTHNSNGVTFNGSTGFGDTKLNSLSVFGTNHLSLHNYVRTWSTGTLLSAGNNNYEWSVSNNITNGSTTNITVPGSSFLGMLSNTRLSASVVKKTFDSNPTNDFAINFVANANVAFRIGNFWNGSSASFWSNANVAFTSIMDALTVAECQTLHQIVYDFELALSRAIPPRVYFYGDSITQGTGASPTANRWSTVMSAAKSYTELNFAVAGTPLESASPIAANNLYDIRNTSIPTKRHNYKYLIIAHAVNDCGYNNGNYTVSLFTTQYQEILNVCFSLGWPASSIKLVAGFFQNGWSNPWGGVPVTPANQARYQTFIDAVASIALSNGCQFIDLSGQYNASQTTDSIHPNNTGHATIASYVGGLLT